MVRKERKTYTREFKQKAVRLAEESSLPVAQVARQLGIHRNMLDSWRKKATELGEKAFVNDASDSASAEALA